jgi:hypothetical protein
VEVGWRRGQLGHELIGAGLIVQMNSQDFGWFTRGKVNGVLDGYFSAIGGHQFIATSKHLDWCSF